MSFWTIHPDAEKLLTELWLQGYTAAYILGAIGAAGQLTRNAVIGKAHRLGLPPHEKAPSNIPPKKLHDPKHRFRRFILPVQEPTMEHTGDPTNYYTHLYAATEHQCRWVVGEVKDLTFCGAPTAQDARLTYCPYHYRRMFYNGKAF
jgi:GcrA cell cycle regulator